MSENDKPFLLLHITLSSIHTLSTRGIQTVYPFYSLWGNWIGVTVAVSYTFTVCVCERERDSVCGCMRVQFYPELIMQYVFVGVAVLSGVVYLVMFLVMVVKAYRHLSSQQSSISHLSPPAQQKARVRKCVFHSLGQFVCVCVCVFVRVF